MIKQERINLFMELQFLKILKEGEMNVSHLQQRANVNPQTLQKYFSYLHSKMYVEMHVNGRFKKLSITENGKKRLDDLEKFSK